MKLAYKLAKLFDTSLNLERNSLIIADGLGKYELFGNYVVQTSANELTKVFDRSTRTHHHFSKLKHAVSWCILLSYNQHSAANRLELLDLKLCSVKTDTYVHRKLLKTCSTTSAKMIYRNKIQEDIYKLKQIEHEISVHINTSIKLQNLSFAERR